MIRRKKRSIVTVSIVAMGDIAFLLLIFFVLAGNFMKQANLQSENPVSPDVEVYDTPQVSVALDAEKQLWIQGTPISVSELVMKIQEAQGDHKEYPIHVKIDKHLTKTDFLPVIEALSESGATMILIGDRGN